MLLKLSHTKERIFMSREYKGRQRQVTYKADKEVISNKGGARRREGRGRQTRERSDVLECEKKVCEGGKIMVIEKEGGRVLVTERYTDGRWRSGR